MSTCGQGLAPRRLGDGAFGGRSKQAIRAWCRASSVYSLASGSLEEESGSIRSRLFAGRQKEVCKLAGLSASVGQSLHSEPQFP